MKRSKQPKPNSKCQCNSGKKYKKCCGKFQVQASLASPCPPRTTPARSRPSTTSPTFTPGFQDWSEAFEQSKATYDTIKPLLDLCPGFETPLVINQWAKRKPDGPPLLSLFSFSENWRSHDLESGDSMTTPVHLAVHEALITTTKEFYDLTQEQQQGLRARCNDHYTRTQALLVSSYQDATNFFFNLTKSDRLDYFDRMLQRFEWSAKGLKMRACNQHEENTFDYQPGAHHVLMYTSLVILASQENTPEHMEFVVPAALVRMFAVNLMCDGEPDMWAFNCHCFDNCVTFPAITCSLLMLGGLPHHGDVVVDTLLKIVVEDYWESWVTSHGMQLCLSICCCLAARQPERFRERVLDVFAALLDKNSMDRCPSENPPCWFLTRVTWFVVFLRGTRIARSIRDAFKRDRLDPMLFGGYTSFLQDMNMKIDYENDKVAKAEIKDPRIWTMGEETEDMIAKKIENAREILSSKASTSGADPRKNSCAQCGSTEVKVQGKTTLLKCSRCKITCYCSPECKNNSPPPHSAATTGIATF